MQGSGESNSRTSAAFQVCKGVCAPASLEVEPTTAAPTAAPTPANPDNADVPDGFASIGKGDCTDDNGEMLPTLVTLSTDADACGKICSARKDCLAYSVKDMMCKLFVATDMSSQGNVTISGHVFEARAGTSDAKNQVTKVKSNSFVECFVRVCKLSCTACGSNWYAGQFDFPVTFGDRNGVQQMTGAQTTTFWTNNDCGCCMKGAPGSNSATSADFQVCKGVCVPQSLDANLCIWSGSANTYSPGYADNYQGTFSLSEAKMNCVEIEHRGQTYQRSPPYVGDQGTCKAVTCAGTDTTKKHCTVREGLPLKTSSGSEYSYVANQACFAGRRRNPSARRRYWS
jgi:hypothetical protein